MKDIVSQNGVKINTEVKVFVCDLCGCIFQSDEYLTINEDSDIPEYYIDTCFTCGCSCTLYQVKDDANNKS